MPTKRVSQVESGWHHHHCRMYEGNHTKAINFTDETI
jgi:hypothetical protein